MGIESLPSKNAAILDVPEVEALTATFQYFYWTADEYENGLGSSQASLKQIPSETFDANYVSLTKKLPRLIKLNWKPVTLNRVASKPENPISIRNFLEKLHSEETFTSNDFTSFRYQDNGVDLRLKFFMDKFASLLPNLESANSADEVIELLNSRTSEQVSARFFAEVISDLKRQGVSYSTPSQTSNDILQRLKNVVLNTRLNNRLLVPITNTVKEDSIGVFSDEFSSETFSKMIEAIQSTAISNANSNLLSPLDYEFEVLAYVGYRPVDTNGYDPYVESLGYIIDKRENKKRLFQWIF
jgi:CRISPR/Cas system CMR-associated protein Cmr5 small subunit